MIEFSLRISLWAMATLAFAVGLLAQVPRASPPVNPAAGQADSHQAAEFVDHGFDLLSTHDRNNAEAAFRKALELKPDLSRAHHGLALALWSGGRRTAAFDELRKAVELDPNDADAHFDLGKLAWDLSVEGSQTARKPANYLDLAANEMALAAKLKPNDLEIRLSLAEVDLEAKRPQDAVAAATEAVSLAPSSAPAHVALGRADLAAGEDVKAAAEAKEALRLDPADAEADYLLGQVSWGRKDPAGAETEFKEAIRVKSDFAPAYVALAQIALERGRPGEARLLLEKDLSLDPRDWQSEYRLATLVSESGETKRALDLLNDVLRRAPGFAPAQEQLGMALVRHGDLPGATAAAQYLEARSPAGPEGHRLMALILW